MFSKSFISFVTLSALLVAEPAFARYRWLERDNKAVLLYPRRFGQENPAIIGKISGACPGGVCATLAGQAIGTLLAGAAECAQQDLADSIIDASKQFDAATAANMVSLAKEFRQAEKNTPPDFTTNPPTNRNSVFCQTAPKNAQLNGLVQAQDPANNPDIFFDPATKQSVKKGAQANTFPFGTSGSAPAAAAPAASSPAAVLAVNTDCPAAVTVTVTPDAAAPTDPAAVTVTAGATQSTAASSAIGNFGKCSVPQIKFGVGFDNRKETSFEPVDQVSFNHGSAQNIAIITQFICDTLTNTCGADQTAKNTCKTAQAAAAAQPPKTGADADAFNAAFGIKTNFAAVQAIDDQGKPVGAAPAAAAPAAAAPTATVAASAAPAAAPASSAAPAAGGGGGIGNFGKCTVPQIKFGVGFDNRKETSFEPADQVSFNHGSAQNIAIITQFICDTLTNSCGADQTAKDTCKTAQAAAAAQPPKTGADADAFNAAFGIKTNFAAVQAIDDQGNPVGAAPAAAAPAAAAPAASSAAPAAAKPAASSGNQAAAGNLQKFTGNLGGVTPPPVTALGNGQFQVTGNAAFNNEQNALVRSCDVQHNQCANAANASGNKGALTVSACATQQTACNAANGA
ncbi:hypothetical protein BD410DRAFT_617640 [Rickenella mellea]|uniref:Uncharacterized protein n=1 Tax=Rickenella mellea TaxID=50990 RepID=A0A4Y7PPY7_9AGAM|nr:hypothetical protein BD410DRAFT_617640 [Rickenella mellea]